MTIYRTLYISEKDDYAEVMFYDEDKKKIWKQKMNMRDYIDLHCMYHEISGLEEISDMP